jgi:signal transduction histidine kinase
VRPSTKAKGQTLNLECASDVRLKGDDAIYEHVVVNLVSNASKYSPAGATVTVRLGDDGTLSVIDEGVGLSARDLALLFDPAERPSNRPTAHEPSSGEGLLLCDRWVKAMGGELVSTSTPGQGTTFTLRLPLANAQR